MKAKLLLPLIILSLVSACAQEFEQEAAVDTKERNALVLQADFAGMVMAGVAYTVSKELDI